MKIGYNVLNSPQTGPKNTYSNPHVLKTLFLLNEIPEVTENHFGVKHTFKSKVKNFKIIDNFNYSFEIETSDSTTTDKVISSFKVFNGKVTVVLGILGQRITESKVEYSNIYDAIRAVIGDSFIK